MANNKSLTDYKDEPEVTVPSSTVTGHLLPPTAKEVK
jgi:hypothetical protein